MKITRLQSGYRIRLTDGEFEAFQLLFVLASADMEGDAREEQQVALSPAGKRGMTRILREHSLGVLDVAEDRRK